MKKRLSKALAAAGVASRRACEELIFEGKVSVNRIPVLMPQTLVDLERDIVTVHGKRVVAEESKVYFLLNKPLGYVCTSATKRGGAKRVIDLFHHLPYRLFSVGRLDQDTGGLIVITNDGTLGNRMVHPSFEVSKEYLVKTLQEITIEHLEALSAGMSIQGMWIKPLSVVKVRKGTLKITIGEGKKHEVRTLLANAGLTILSLTRIRIGPLTLGTLPVGEYRELTAKEIEFFLESQVSNS